MTRLRLFNAPSIFPHINRARWLHQKDFWMPNTRFETRFEINYLGKTYFPISNCPSLCSDFSISVLSLFAFSALTFHLFSSKLCLQISGLRMRNITWNWFPIEKFADQFLACPHCRENALQYRYVEDWTMAKRWKQSPVGFNHNDKWSINILNYTAINSF